MGFRAKPRPVEVLSNQHPNSREPETSHRARPYRDLAVMGLVHLPIMYLVMFTMIYSLREFVNNLNMLYMAGMMVAPMIILMPLFMRRMYPDRKRNLLIFTFSALVFAVLFGFMRNQTFINDRQFLRSMIPHHSGAVLMCERAKLRDPEVAELCGRIIEGQKAEIAQMNQILDRMGD